MIIFENGFIKLNYSPATDILSFEMPNAVDVVMPEMQRSFAIIVEHVRNYDVKNVLLDARNTDMWIEEESYISIISQFYENLALTRIQKIARLITPESVREKTVKKLFETTIYPMEVKQFAEEEAAVEWLKQGS